MDIKLGNTYIEVVTGFVGVAVAHVIYATGCDRVELKGQSKDGKGEVYSADSNAVAEHPPVDPVLAKLRDKIKVPLDHPKRVMNKQAFDKVTGFKGLVIGTAVHFPSGSINLCLAPKVNAKGERGAGEWFDIDRVQFDTPVVSALKKLTKGGDRASDRDANTR